MSHHKTYSPTCLGPIEQERIVSPFVVPLCFQRLVRLRPMYRLVVPLPRVRIIHPFGCVIVPQHSVHCLRFRRRPFALVLLP